MGEPDRRVRRLGAVALLAGAVSATVVAVDGTGRLGGAFVGEQPTIYGPAQAGLAVVLAVSGLLVLASRRRAAVVTLVGVIGLCAAQLAGAGIVGYRRWPLFWGCCTSEAVTQGGLIRALAVVMASVCAVTAAACVVVLVRERSARGTGFDLPPVVALAAALVVAVAGPRLVVGGWDDHRELAAWSLMYALPFAAGLALSALLPRVAALTMAGAVAGSALISTLGNSFLELIQPWGDARPLVIAAAVAVAVTRLLPRPKPAPAEATPSSR